MDCVLGLDLGSASTKVVAFGRGGRPLATGARPMEIARLDPTEPGWAFWDPQAVWRNATAAVAEVAAALPAGARVRGLAVTGLGMDGLPVDDEGRALYPFISWHCPRTAATAATLGARLGRERMFGLTGKQPQNHDTLYRLSWMGEHRPEVMARASTWLLIEDWLNFRLCGARATDPTMASSTGLYDQRAGTWATGLVADAGIALRLLPEVRPCGSFLGELLPEAAAATGLPPGTPVLLGGHDYLCAALGEGVVTPGALLDVVGTWEMVLSPSEAPRLEPAVFRAGLTVEATVVPKRWAVTGFAVAGGAAEWYRRELAAPGAGWVELERLARGAPAGARGAFFLPHLEGAGSPRNDPRSRGALVGLSAECDRACLARALFEGLAHQSAELVDAVTAAAGSATPRIVVTGGLGHSELWTSLKADLGARPLWVSAIAEATALGAALLAEVGLGWHRDAVAAAGSVERRGHLVEPGGGAGERARHEVYQSIYPALKNLGAGL